MKNIIKIKNIGKVLLLGTLLPLVSCEDVEYPPHSTKNAVESIFMKIPGTDSKFEGIISDVTDTIYFNVNYNYPILNEQVTDLSNMLIVANLPLSATVSPALGNIQDCRVPIPIKIKAGDGSVKNYILKARLVKSNGKAITKFSLTIDGKEAEGLISEDKKEVTFLVMPDVAESLKGKLLVPTMEISPRATCQPDTTTARDFSKDVTYTITAQDGSTQEWTIKQREPSYLDKGIGFCRKVWVKGAVELGTDDNFRGMTIVKEGIVVVKGSGGGSELKLIDKETGATLATPNTTGFEGGSMYVVSDSEGKLLASTFPAWSAGNFNLYYWKDGIANPPVRLIQKAGLGDCGRKISIVGNINTNAIVYSTQGKGNKVFKFHIENGKWITSKDEEIIIKEIIGQGNVFTYMCNPMPLSADEKSQFILVDQQLRPDYLGANLYAADGAKISTFSGGNYRNIMVDGKVFDFNNSKFFVFMDMASNDLGKIKVFDISTIANFSMAPGAEGYDKFSVFTGEDLATTDNGNGTGAIAYEISSDQKSVFVYQMLTYGGIAKYELTTIDMN